MKVGFTEKEFTSMYHSLSTEVFTYFGYDAEPPEFSVWDYSRGYPFNGTTIGDTWFADFRTGLEVVPREFACDVTFNSLYLPLLWEDEAIGAIIHEAAHVVAGFHAQHSLTWSRLAAEVGGHAEAFINIRNQDKVYWTFVGGFGRMQTPTYERYKEEVPFPYCSF